MVRTSLVISVLLFAAGAPALAQDEPVEVKWGAESIVLDLPDFEDRDLEWVEGREQLRLKVYGQIGETFVTLSVYGYDRTRHRLYEPEDVLELTEWDHSDPKGGGDRDFQIGKRRVIEGKYGWAPYVAVGSGKTPEDWVPRGDFAIAAGLLEEVGYSIEVVMAPKGDHEVWKLLDEFFAKGIRSERAARNPEWTEDEVERRWERAVPNEKTRKKRRKTIRTKHYVILTNSSGGKLFAKKMEESYTRIQKEYPFPEVEGRRLMPVFLFRTPNQYYGFHVHEAKISRATAETYKGHAWRDFYATYYEAPNDPVHIHEATHQIFRNRLYLSGGGSWFQEGVAEYVERKYHDRNAVKAWAKRAIKDEKVIPFTTFVTIPSLIDNKHAETHESYMQAASFIGFLRDSKFAPEKFPQWMRAIGKLPRRNLARIQETTQEIYGVDLDGLQEAWAKDWLERK